jgi:hypothetical protein
VHTWWRGDEGEVEGLAGTQGGHDSLRSGLRGREVRRDERCRWCVWSAVEATSDVEGGSAADETSHGHSKRRADLSRRGLLGVSRDTRLGQSHVDAASSSSYNATLPSHRRTSQQEQHIQRARHLPQGFGTIRTSGSVRLDRKAIEAWA